MTIASTPRRDQDAAPCFVPAREYPASQSFRPSIGLQAGTSARRAVLRLAWLLFELARAAFAVPFYEDRARWLQVCCRRLLRVFNVRLETHGPIPQRGLLVCNHLSYLDILVIGAATPSVFVSKCEVKRWPAFGWLASRAGTIFLRREKRMDVKRVIREMCAVLDNGALVVLFPEGTTSDGEEVLPFKTALFEPATANARLTAGSIEYAVRDGNVADEVCYWGDMTLVPHLLKLLGKRGVSAQVAFAPICARSAGRKELARAARAEVLRLKRRSL